MMPFDEMTMDFCKIKNENFIRICHFLVGENTLKSGATWAVSQHVHKTYNSKMYFI
jgi:hypothetical protein